MADATIQGTVTRTQLARLVGMTPSSVSRLIAEGMPVLKTGAGRGNQTELDLGESLRWLLKRKQGDLDVQRTRYYQAQADKTQLDITKRRGELVDVADVERRWAALIVASRERLLALPAIALQRGLIAPAAEDEVIGLVDEALLELVARGNHASK